MTLIGGEGHDLIWNKDYAKMIAIDTAGFVAENSYKREKKAGTTTV